MEIELGLDFLTAEKEAEEALRPLPAGDYQFQITAVEQKISGSSSKNPGRPYLNWTFSVINSGIGPALGSEYNGKKLFYSTPLPIQDQQTGKMITSGINFLVDLCKALGQPWQSGRLQTENYIGRTATARVSQKTGSNGKIQNQVDEVF